MRIGTLIASSSAGNHPAKIIDLCPTKIIGIGRNYREHAAELGNEVLAEPLVFLKPPSAIIGNGEAIVRPRGYDQVHHEAELGVVIGQEAHRVPVADAMRVVRGFTCVNDVTVRDLQNRDGQWTRAKGFDSFCPIGPVIVEGLDPSDLRVVCRVNGQIRQDSRTSLMIFPVAELIAFISEVMTLQPGDVIATGTPAGVSNVSPGDVVEIEIEHIGILRNPVIEAPGA